MLDDDDLMLLDAIREERKRNRKRNKLKWCSKCKEWKKSKKNFYRNASTKDGLAGWCKGCARARAKTYRERNREKERARNKTYREKNPEKVHACVKTYREKNPEKVRACNKAYYEKNPEKIHAYNKAYRERNHEKTRAYNKAYRERNPGKVRARDKARYENNIKRRLSVCVSSGMQNSLKTGKHGHHWESLVPYTLADLIAHLESQWQPGMNWQNYGRGKRKGESKRRYWVIDHKKPISAFHFSSYEDKEFRECWVLSNLQPMWAEENMRKGAKWPYNPPARNKDDKDAKEAS